MASSSEKEAIMPRPNDTETDLEEVHQLNGLFLDFLRSRVRTGGDCLGLPVNAARLLGKVPPEHLDAIVAFPTALFRLDLDVLETPRVLDPAADLEDPAKFALQHGILHSARSLCRHRPYAARLFLGLGDKEIRRLRRMPLNELRELAALPGILRCAHCESVRLWEGLLSETRPESRRVLFLLGLQPKLDRICEAPVSA